MFDGEFNNPDTNLHKEIVTHDNILDLFKKYKISEEIGILSEDTDYGDYWIVNSILSKYSPSIVIHEVNEQETQLCVTVPKPNEVIYWDRSEYHGASVCAFYCLAKQFNYTMIYCEKAGVNCFWVQNELLEKHLKVSAQIVQNILTPEFLFRKPKFVYHKTNKSWDYIKC